MNLTDLPLLSLSSTAPRMLKDAFRVWDRAYGRSGLVLLSPDRSLVIKFTACDSTKRLLSWQASDPLESLPSVRRVFGRAAIYRRFGYPQQMSAFEIEWLDTGNALTESLAHQAATCRQDVMIKSTPDIGEPALSLATIDLFLPHAPESLRPGLERVRAVIAATQGRFDLIVGSNWMRRGDIIVLADPIISTPA